MKRTFFLLVVSIISFSFLSAQTTPGPREGHSLVYRNDTLYLFGGVTIGNTQQSSATLKNTGDITNDFWGYVKGKSWGEIADTNPPDARIDHTATTLPDGRIIVLFGNPGDGGDYLRDGHIYNPKTKQWEELNFSGPVPNNRARHCAAVIGNKLYIFGGLTRYTSYGITYSSYSNDLFSLDLTNNTWDYIPVMGNDVPPPTYGAAMVAYNGKLYIFTGKTQAGGETSYSKKAYEYDPETEQYKELTSLPGDGRFKAQATVNEEKGEITVWGGGTASERFNECWIYNVQNDNWSQGTIPDEVDLYLSKAATDGQGTTWVYGGIDETSALRDDFYKVENQGEETEEWSKYNWETVEWQKIGGEKPTLTLGKSAVQYEPICPYCENCPGSGTPTEKTIANLSISVDDLDGWQVTSIGFNAWGSGKDDQYIKEVRLYVNGGLTGTGTYTSDNGAISLSIGKHLQAGETINLKLMYVFDFPYERSSNHYGEFGVTTSVALVSATPDTYLQYYELPSTVFSCGPQLVAPVENTNTGEYFATIQESIDAENTKDGHTIQVCPGVYTENVIISKELTVKSREGREATTIYAINDQEPTVKIEKDNTTINGFTIMGAQSNSGISVSGSSTNNTINNSTLCNNTLTSNYNGLIISYANGLSVTNSLITENLNSGIKIEEMCTNAQIGNDSNPNTISKNKNNGIEIEGALSGNVIEGNFIGTTKEGDSDSGNEHNGISIECPSLEKNYIRGNTISGNNNYGIELKNTTERWHVTSNLIGTNQDASLAIPNKEGGIYLVGSKNVIGSSESESDANIIENNSSFGIKITGKNNYILGNSISKNDYYGILSWGGSNKIISNHIYDNGNSGIVCESSNDTISRNFIGNKDGIAKPNQGYGIELLSGNNVVGGNLPEERNIISGNLLGGIHLTGIDCEIINNYIGTAESGNSILANNGNGITIRSVNILPAISNKIISNIISGNDEHGIAIIDKKSVENHIKQNIIGLNSEGNATLFNTGSGISSVADKTEIANNAISGNVGKGINISGNKCTISNNLIGTDISGMIKIKNSQTGLFASGDSCTISSNTVSGNGENGVVIAGSKNTISRNYIGVDNSGEQAIGNAQNGLVIFGNKNIIERNVISGNTGIGIQLNSTLHSCQQNSISHNNIGVGSNGETPLPNQIGILLNNVDFNEIRKNIVGANSSTGIKLNNSCNNNINANRMVNNSGAGIYLYRSNSCALTLNEVNSNCKGIYVVDSYGTKLSGNYGKDNECATGIHFDHSFGKITGNTITGDAADAIKCKNGSNPLIIGNNIYNNNGKGLNNLDASLTIMALNNWWGDASGPSGAGSGSGEEVSENIDFSGWLSEAVSVVAATEADTIYIPAGHIDSIICSFQNWSNLSDVVNVNLHDEKGWLQTASPLYLEFSDNLGIFESAVISVPEAENESSIDKFYITAVSQANAENTATDSTIIITYQPYLASMKILPDSTSIMQGDSLYFYVEGTDQKEKSFSFEAEWTASSGSINTNGYFKAGNQEELVYITATDSDSQQSVTALIQVVSETPETDTIIVSPDSVTLNPGETVQFSTRCYDQYGMKTEPSLSWETTGGNIDASGYFVAGDEAGTFTVTANTAGVYGQAIVIVEEIQYSLTLGIEPSNASDAGCTVSQSGNGTYEEGETATLTATPANEWIFTGWTGSSTSTDNPLELIMDGDKTLTANFELLNAIGQPGQNNEICFYPNPVSGILTIDLPQNARECHLKIFDMTGKVVLENANFSKGYIDLSRLAKGSYLIYLQHGNNTYKELIVKN